MFLSKKVKKKNVNPPQQEQIIEINYQLTSSDQIRKYFFVHQS